ncbi:MAG: enoyl-CoA hydratase-related protein [Antricoccus sp.]
MSPLSVTRDGGLVTACFDGTRGNALDHDRYASLHTAADSVDAGEVLLIRALGRNFCCGQDLTEYAAAAADGRSAAQLRHGTAAILAVLRCRGMVIVAAQGAAIGAGALIVAAADVVVLADDAWFRLPELELGLPLGLAVAERLAPAPVVRRMMLTGSRLTADRLVEVATVVPTADLGAESQRLAEHVAGLDGRAVRTARRLWGADERERAAMAYELEVAASVQALARSDPSIGAGS